MNYFEKAQMKHELLAKARAAKLKRYKDNANDFRPLVLSHEGTLGGKIEETLSKEIIPLQDNQVLDIITNHNLNRDTTLLLRTRAAMVKQLLRAGQLKPQALTAKAIKAVGKYQAKTASRAVKSRIESTLSFEKQTLVAMAQDRIEHLQELERFIGHRVHQADQVFDQVLAAFDRYSQQQELYLTENTALQSYLGSGFSAAYRESILRSDQATASDLKASFVAHQGDAAWLQSSGYDLLHSFIKRRITGILRQTEALNQILTHRNAYLRGDLASYLEDALYLVGKDKIDFHNPITHDHQLNYPDPEKEIIIDSDNQSDGSREELEEFLLMVSQYCGNNEPLTALKGPVTLTPATKWLHFRAFYDASSPYAPSVFRAKHLLGMIWNWLLAPLNLVETIIRGNAASLFASLGYEPPESPDVHGKTDYYALIYWIKESTALSTRIGLLVHNIFSYFFWEGIILGVYDGLCRLLRLPAELFTDFHNQDVLPDQLLWNLREELLDINEIEALVKAGLGPEGQIDEVEKPGPCYAKPEVSLSPYSSHGLWNSSTDGFISMMDIFGHHMFAKHPFTGIFSTAGAGASLLAFYATPTAVSLMGKGYVKFLLDQGYMWTRDFSSAAISSAISNFELMGAVIDGIEHGPDSWIGRGLCHLIKDPATIITFTTLSWMLGYAMVYEVDIPGLSEELRAQMGSSPEPTEIFGGAKVLLLGKHLIASPHEYEHPLAKDYVEQSVTLYRAMHKEKGVEVSAADEAEFRASLELMVSLQNMKALRNELSKHLSQNDKDKLTLMLMLSANKERLKYLSPLLKAKLEHQLKTITGSSADANAVEQWLDPEHHVKQSTIRSFIGKVLAYIPALARCALSPLTFIFSWSLSSALRSWRELGNMILDDLASTVHAVLNLTHKVLECLLNRLPRTVADIVVNSIFSRIASFFGYDGIALNSYAVSASWDNAQEALKSNTTGWLMNSLARVNTAPHPEIGLQNGVEAQMRAGFEKSVGPGFFNSGLAEVNKADKQKDSDFLSNLRRRLKVA